MAETFEVVFEDGVSEPARKASESLGGLAERMKDTVGLSGAFGKMTQAFGRLLSPAVQGRDALGRFTEKIGPLDSAMDTVAQGFGIAATTIAGVTGVVVALGAGVGAAVGEILELNEQEARLSAQFDALGSGGSKTLDMLDGLRKELGLTREQMAPLAKQVAAMGITDLPEMEKAIRAVTAVQAVMGQGGADAFNGILGKVQLAIQSHKGLKLEARSLGNQLRSMGLTLDDLAKAMGTTGPKLAAALKAGTVDATRFRDALESAASAKGAAALAQQADSLSAKWDIFKEQILDAFRSIIPAGSNAEKALKAAFGAALDTILAIAKKVFPYIKKGFEIIAIAILKAYIALKPSIAEFKKLWAQQGGGISFNKVMLNVVGGIMLFAKATLAALKMVNAIMAAIDKWEAMFTRMKGWVDMARNIAGEIVQGFVQGITGGAGSVGKSIADMGKAALSSLKSALGIHSPSTVFLQMGKHVSTGFGQGMTAAGPHSPERASKAMAASATAGTSSGASGGSKSVTIDVGGITIQGVGTSGEALVLTEQSVAMVFEKLAASQGLA